MKNFLWLLISLLFLGSCSHKTRHSFLIYDENEVLNSTAALTIEKKKAGLLFWNTVENEGRVLLIAECDVKKDSIHIRFPNEVSSGALYKDSLKLISFTIRKDSSSYHFVEQIREKK